MRGQTAIKSELGSAHGRLLYVSVPQAEVSQLKVESFDLGHGSLQSGLVRYEGHAETDQGKCLHVCSHARLKSLDDLLSLKSSGTLSDLQTLKLQLSICRRVIV